MPFQPHHPRPPGPFRHPKDRIINQKIGSRYTRYLTECERGEEVTILSVNAGYRAKTRLANLGIVPGVKVKKIKNAPFRGPIEIKVKGSSLVLGRGLASKIIVSLSNSFT
ncbi:MAG: ferrous iron transport protein A [Promethearchaeota archaeon]